MSRTHRVSVFPLPPWLPSETFLGEGTWTRTNESVGLRYTSELTTEQAADLCARLRNLGLNGHALIIDVHPRLKRNAVRAARTIDAKRRRNTTPGFTNHRAFTHPEGRIGLTPERLAHQMATQTNGLRVYDACCGLGGNSLAFAQAGATVTAVEQNGEILALARKNANLYDVSQHIHFIHGDTLTQRVAADICFVDPPWGVDWDRIHCGLHDFPLAAALWERFSDANWDAFWLKVPSSFNPSTLHPAAEVVPYFGAHPGDRQRIKFILLKVRRNDLYPLPN